ncbi:MAG: type II secretion system protein, partial [Clostridia bacterium]|nr:type II secretion system protein [Clostridia bacterium]
MKEKLRKKQEGITLVALVVTIVVLLILAGITIMYTMGENSIFKKAQEAKNKTAEAIKNEQEYMNEVDNMVDKYMNGTGNGGGPDTPTEPEEV